MERLRDFRHRTGRSVSLLTAVSEFVEAASKLNGHTLAEAVEPYLNSVANGHIEVTASKSKTRQRRLVEVCPALAAWLAPFRTCTAGKLCTLHEITGQQQFLKLCETAGVTRKPNGLRHAFCSYRFAAHANENQTTAQAGNSPAMIHAHYKGLATKAEAQQWFALKPARVQNVVPLSALSRKHAH